MRQGDIGEGFSERLHLRRDHVKEGRGPRAGRSSGHVGPSRRQGNRSTVETHYKMEHIAGEGS